MRRAGVMLAVLLAAGCDQFTGSFGDAIAIELRGPATRRLEEGDTLTLHARALDLAGDSIAADIRWVVIDTAVGFTLDGATGLVTGVTPGGPWRVQPRVDALVGDPVRITVAGAPDSIAAQGDTAVIAVGTEYSGAMSVLVFDLTTVPGAVRALGGATVHFRVVQPTGAGLLLRGATAADSTATADTTGVVTGGTGLAAAVLRATGTVPDSAVVAAAITTAVGGAVAGSPVRFVVHFQ